MRGYWGTLLATVLAVAGPGEAQTRVGEPAPHYAVRLLDGTRIDSDALAGQVVIVNRWAVWCGPCRAELPALDAYARAHARDGLRVYAATIDDTATPAQLRKLAGFLSFALARGIEGGFPVLGGVPTSYVVDRAGIVRYAAAAAFDATTLDRVIGPLLAEPPPAR